MRENCTSGIAPGAPGNRRSYGGGHMNSHRSQPSRLCLREPIPEIENAAAILADAVNEHLAGRRSNAAELLARAEMPSVRSWTESLWGKMAL